VYFCIVKLKRNIALFFTCYYLVISVGLSMTLHFCGGSLAGMSVTSREVVCEVSDVQDVCCFIKSETKSGCCNDTVLDLSEVDEDSLLDSSNILKQYIAIAQNVLCYFFTNTQFKNKVALPNYTFQSNAPPLYKLYGTYIYYA